MRIYLPSTLTIVEGAHRQGRLNDGPTTAYAVTPSLREWYAQSDLEELEYAAQALAARASLALLAADPTAPRRRVVLAADVADPELRQLPDAPRGVVGVGVVPWSALASVLADAAEAEPAIRAAVVALAAAELGEPDARFTVDGADDEELLWYAVQEVPELLEGLQA